jgi:predicted nucleotidyltransferase
MSTESVLDPLSAPVTAVQRLIERFDNQGVIIGGVAVSVLGQPRLTADADALLLASIEDISRLLELASAEGLQPRIPDVATFARRNRILLLQHEPSGIHVDISLGILPFEVEAVERSQEHQAGALRVRLPSPEDLIILKAVAHRQKDLLDIETVIATRPQLDQDRIEFWVKQFAELLETPEIWTDVERLLRRAKNNH